MPRLFARAFSRLSRARRAGRLSRLIFNRLRQPFLVPAAYVWRRLLFKTTFIAVAGSAGKTTTKELLFAVLQKHYPTIRSKGTLNDDFGLPVSILTVRPWHRFAVIEIGVSQPGDMTRRARLLNADIALLLDIKGCHINTFRNVEAIAAEKALLLERLGDGCTAVVNLDNPFIAAMLPELTCRIVGFGRDAGADVRLLDAESRWPRRLSLTVEARGGRQHIETQLVGTHWANTVLAVLAVAELCAIAAPDARAAIAALPPFWARLQPVTLPCGAVMLRDDWQGAFDTTDAAWKVMREATADRKIVIFSDYSQTNKKSRVRANHLGNAAAKLADMAIFVGAYAERSSEAAVAAGLDRSAVHPCEDVREASDLLRRVLRRGDLVLLKGPHTHHLSRIHLGLVGPVVCNLQTCDRIRLCDQCPDLGFKWTAERDGLMAPPSSGL